jgi:1,6-anhydro-N-acetylmuramate kinase
MYSKMLYMKTRVTFRVAEDLADTLRALPNQTAFVELALREALRDKCPACGGTGRASSGGLRVSNLRSKLLGALGRDAALQLKNVVALARHAAATEVLLEKTRASADIGFVVVRGETVLTRGTLPAPSVSERGTASWPS